MVIAHLTGLCSTGVLRIGRKDRSGSFASLCSSANYFRSSPVNGRRQGQWHVSKVPTTEVALIRSLRRKRSSLATMVIRAARLAAILLRIAKGLRPA